MYRGAMDGGGEQATGDTAGSAGCGCAAAIAFLVVVGLPVLFVFSFGMSPCADGPCYPDGARNFRIVALVLVALAALVGALAWRLAVWWARRRAARGRSPDPS